MKSRDDGPQRPPLVRWIALHGRRSATQVVSIGVALVVTLMACVAGFAGESRWVALRLSGRVVDMNGEPFHGTARVVLRANSLAPETADASGRERAPTILEWLEVQTDATGAFATTHRVDAGLARCEDCTIRLLPRSTSGTYLAYDEAVANAYTSRGWFGARAIEHSVAGELLVALDSVALEPAPTVGRLRIASRYPLVALGAYGLDRSVTNGSLPPVPLRDVATNTWLEFHSWSTWDDFGFECETGARETLFVTCFERAAERDLECVPTCALIVAVDPLLPANGVVELVPTSDGHARRLVARRLQSGPTPPAHPDFRPDVYAANGYGTSPLVRHFPELPDGTYRAEYWPRHADEHTTPLAVAEFTVPHVGWIALTPR